MDRSTPITDELIQTAYFLLLGRAPESQQVIDRCRDIGTAGRLRDTIMNSREFLSQCLHRLDNRNSHRIVTASKAPISDDPLILQTCDFEKYVPMLKATSPSVLEYVKRWKLGYESFVGIKRGAHPWHAMFNRIYKLNEYVDAGFRGWVLYMDADAYFVDFNFDLRSYLADKGRYALIASKVSDADAHPYWDINDGIFLANLAHPVCTDILRRWKRYYDVLYKSEDYQDAFNWNTVLNDQTSLHAILKFSPYEAFVHTDRVRDLFNSRRASVIQQELRADHNGSDDSNFERRVARIKNKVDAALARSRSGVEI